MRRAATSFPRYLAPRLREALADTPAILIHGPRQSGKTTLARAVGEPRGYGYESFDDDATRDAAVTDPVGFVDRLPPKVILDEVQRVPGLFTSLKAAIDRRRTSGRFILTGSANVLLVPALADSLAGRMGILRLHPLAQCEIENTRPRFIETLFQRGFKTGLSERLGVGLAERIVSGGYPAALARRTMARRQGWYRDYVDTQVQRDVRDFTRLRSFDALPKLLTLAAGQTARLVNVTELAGPFELTRQTIHDYVTLLERVFLVERLSPWHRNRLSRLVKRPKLHMGDTGVACALLGINAAGLDKDRQLLGQMLETFVLQELRRQATWRPIPIDFYHFRDRDDFEVDMVLEQGHGAVAGVEVKSAATVTDADFRGLRKLRDAAGDHFVAGAVLYDGRATINYGDNLFAVPVRRLWEAT
ncbi:MAG: ATP-binding protein [Vicinamibacteraceae bacterium]